MSPTTTVLAGLAAVAVVIAVITIAAWRVERGHLARTTHPLTPPSTGGTR